MKQKHIARGIQYANRTVKMMAQRKLEPLFSDWALTKDDGLTVLFGVLDVRRLARIEQYTDPRLLHHVSTICNGVPVLVSNTNGLRYAYILDYEPSIPTCAEFPGIERGMCRLGIGVRGDEIKVAWDKLGHLLVGGKTGMGKSNFLRLLTYQAIAEGAALYLSDLDGCTFPMLIGSPALVAPIASTPDEAHTLVAHALAEIERRNALYNVCDGYPESLSEYNGLTRDEKLPRALVILDEYNSTATTLGGARGTFCKDVATLSFRARKFGLNIIVAAQDFEKAVAGRARDQMEALCFRLKSHALARLVDCTGATNLRNPGRAISSRWGMLQTYLIDKMTLADGAPSILSDAELAMIGWAQSANDGYLPLSEIQKRLGLSQHKTRALACDWERRGWLAKDAGANNTRRITEDLAKLALFSTNRQTRQTRQTLSENRQTPSEQVDKPVTSRQTPFTEVW